ncbi:hypothetical protein [Rudaeicoccus suwonensis]|uniref:Uncharacterized protein n=1 Tax=Rudaeicoccus suwonensis TaxID=657409 RepID=A0A561E8N8_9MICO|nr:hypothetical protein [Rudaeicoccus suwonensis]TWE11971.1 hypothetical protein BKA23_0766 [Rudaeicoccus suwonensis]
MSSTIRQPSRRTLAKGAAWSVPIIALGGPAMAATVSPGLVPRITTACTPHTGLTGPNTVTFSICAGVNGLPAGTVFTLSYSSTAVGTTPTVTTSAFSGGSMSNNGSFNPSGSGALTLINTLAGGQCVTLTASITSALFATTTATLAGEGASTTYTFHGTSC